jgi:hypothetical protein
VGPNNVTQLVGSRLQAVTGGLQVGVSERILHLDHVGAGLEGLGGERVAEGVDQGTRRLLGAETGSPVQPGDRVLHGRARHRLPVVADEEGSFLG